MDLCSVMNKMGIYSSYSTVPQGTFNLRFTYDAIIYKQPPPIRRLLNCRQLSYLFMSSYKSFLPVSEIVARSAHTVWPWRFRFIPTIFSRSMNKLLEKTEQNCMTFDKMATTRGWELHILCIFYRYITKQHMQRKQMLTMWERQQNVQY